MTTEEKYFTEQMLYAFILTYFNKKKKTVKNTSEKGVCQVYSFFYLPVNEEILVQHNNKHFEE